MPQKVNMVDLGDELNLDELFAGEIDYHRWNEKGHFALDTMSYTELAFQNARGYWEHYRFGGWTAEGVGRIVHGGKLEQGPYAYLNQTGVMITAAQLPEKTVYVIREGSLLTVAGTTYRVTLTGYHNNDLALEVAA